jgi:hypothetical protein
MNYFVVLFKNKQKKKIINKFKTYDKAKGVYDKLIKESEEVFFEKKTENGQECEFELVLMVKNSENYEKIYIKDNLGRAIKVQTDDTDLTIKFISEYKIEESFIDYKTKEKIDFSKFKRKYLNGVGVKLISKLNNKIIVQQDENINLFTFKSENDCEKFLDELTLKFQKEKRIDCLIVKDSSSAQKKYLYNILTNCGFPINYLQRYSTTHLSRK